MGVEITGCGDLTHYICEEFVGVAQTITDHTLLSLRISLADCEPLTSTTSETSPAYNDVHSTPILAC